MQPSMALATPENSPTSAFIPPSRGNSSPIRSSHRSSSPMACSVSTVSASSSASSIAPTWARRTFGRMSCRPPNGGVRPADKASAISVVRAWRSRISPMSRLGSSRRAPSFPSEQAARAATRVRIFSNSRSSSVCVSMNLFCAPGPALSPVRTHQRHGPSPWSSPESDPRKSGTNDVRSNTGRGSVRPASRSSCPSRASRSGRRDHEPPRVADIEQMGCPGPSSHERPAVTASLDSATSIISARSTSRPGTSARR